MSKPAGPPEDGLAEAATPHYLGHRERVRERFNKLGGEAFSDAELLELVLQVCIPRRDTKELAKTLLNVFGRAGSATRATCRVLWPWRSDHYSPACVPGSRSTLRP
jgi:DNA repair protein RadC